MLTTPGWMLLAGLLVSSPTGPIPPTRPAEAPARVAVWADREEPYRRGEAAWVYLSVDHPAHVAVFRVDTDGRIEVLFPAEPWDDTYLRETGKLEVTAGRGGRAFIVEDDPGIGYLFAVASPRKFDFEDIVRGDHWDYRAIEGGRIRGDPYVALADLAARLAPGDDYDYDVNTYHVERRYAYPRFVCYDCHAYASYDEWDPYRRACERFRVVIYDDPRYYPYRVASGRTVVMPRPRRPGPRFVFRDADPERAYVTRVRVETGEYRRRNGAGRTSRDVGGRGVVPAPGLTGDASGRRGVPPLRPNSLRPPAGEGEADGRRRVVRDTPPASAERKPAAEPERRPAAEPRDKPSAPPRTEPKSTGEPRRTAEPRSTGEPELRRRKP